MLVIYNSKTKQKQPFKPIHTGRVNLYVCGITVYDYCHLGHARSMVVFDVVYRFLSFLGFKVNYVRNITDIDDKIIKRAQENGQTIRELTEQMITAMDEDFAKLAILVPTMQPKATAYVDKMIDMIQVLVAKGFAYQGEGGDVYYDVSQFACYGQLSHRNLDKLLVGERIQVAVDKKSPLDFVLWKKAKLDEPSFASPWGRGRPGWHIECSTMCCDCLNADVDIHGGGMDLLFPHHENELAQSEAFLDKKIVNYWIHCGFLNINDEKMSKSLGNFFTIREVLEIYHPETIRYLFLTTHYRSPFNYSEENVAKAHSALESLYRALCFLESLSASDKELDELSDHQQQPCCFYQDFLSAMNDDFNTVEACAVLFNLAHHINRLVSAHKSSPSGIKEIVGASKLLKKLAAVLGILQQSPSQFLQHGLDKQNQSLQLTEIEQLIKERIQARHDKNWHKADEIRNRLQSQGIVLEDQNDKTIWRRMTKQS